MGPDLVVVLPPGFYDLSGMPHAHEPVGVQAFVAQPAVEALSKGVLYRLARADKAQLDAPPICPLIHDLACEFRAVVHSDHLR